MVGKYKVITLCGSTRFKDQFLEVQKRLLIRLKDARHEVQGIISKAEYPTTSMLERAYDAIETAESYLKKIIE